MPFEHARAANRDRANDTFIEQGETKVRSGTVVAATLAIALASAPALGQTTLFGHIKVGVDRTTRSGNGSPDLAATRVTDSTSYWGIKTSEDLGGGLKAGAHMELDFKIDTGEQGNNRNMGVFLSGPWGKVTLGRWSMYFSHHWFLSPQGAFDVGPHAANDLNVLHTINGRNSSGGFVNNQIRYESPRWNGFGLAAAVSMDTENRPSDNAHTVYLNPTYRSGRILGHFAHMRRSDQSGTASGSFVSGTSTFDQVSNRLGFQYHFDNGLRVGVVVDRNTVEGAGHEYARNAFSVPVIYETGKHRVSVTYGKALAYDVDGVEQRDTGATMLAMTYQHALSKRTFVGATFTMLNNEANGRYNFWLRGFDAPKVGGTDNRMIYLGIKHTF